MVFLDGNFAGITTSELSGFILQDVPAGRHEVKIIKEGYRPRSEEIDLKENEKYIYEVKYFQSALTWERTYGGIDDIDAKYLDHIKLIQTTDGGYAIARGTYDNWNLNLTGTGDKDFWLLKLDSQGDLLWNKTYNRRGFDMALSLVQTTDGGYAVTGTDFWLIKLDSQGNLLWDQTYGGSGDDRAHSLIQTTDGGYAIAGITSSKDSGAWDFWLLKLDNQGNVLWDRTYGGSRSDWANSLIQTKDGGYAMVGTTESKSTGSSEEDFRRGDFWLLKLDSKGNLLWDQTYGGIGHDWAYSLIQTTDGGYIVVGITNSKGAGNKDNFDFQPMDIRLLRLDSQGDLLWDRTYGGSGEDRAYSLIQTTDGGYAIAGGTSSKGAGSLDFWLLKLDNSGNVIWDQTYGGIGKEWATSLIQTTDGCYAMAGCTTSKGSRGLNFWIIKVDAEGNLQPETE